MINKGKSTSYLTSFKELIISRVEMLFVFTWNAAVGSLIASRGLPEIKATIYGMISALLLTLAAYIYNDIIDKDMDAESPYIPKKEQRVIAHRIVPVKHAYALVILSSIIGLGSSYLANIMTFKIGLAYWIVLMLYSFPRVRFKSRYIMKTVVTAFGGPFFPLIIGGSAVNNAVSPLILFVALVSGTYAFLVKTVVTHYADLKEDRIHVFATNILSVILIVIWSLLTLNKARKLQYTYSETAFRIIQKSILAFFILFDFLIFIGTLNLSVIIPFY